MALSDAYFTAAEYLATDRGRIDTSRNADVDLDALAISRYLEQRLGRFFNKDASPVVRYFDPRHDAYDLDGCGYTRSLMVNDIATSVGVTVAVDSALDGSFATAFASGDFELRPLNAALGPEAWPFTEIYLPGFSATSARGYWYSAERVKVTAVWGWPSVPVPIKRAAIRLCEVLRLDGARGTREINDVGSILGVNRQAQGIIDDLIQRYARGTALVGFA